MSVTHYGAVSSGRDAAAKDYQKKLEGMLLAIERDIVLTQDKTGVSKLSSKVRAALCAVPRHEFVREEDRRYAYENHPLAIGEGQTISQPYIVALMTALARVQKNAKVLEVGTGSGYQAAVLSRLAAQVYTLEIIAGLATLAEERFARLHYTNIHVHVASGYFGWEAQAPFDAIIVTAAASHIPQPLIQQLKPGGRLVMPVGGTYSGQDLVVLEKKAGGRTTITNILPVAFVPLVERVHH